MRTQTSGLIAKAPKQSQSVAIDFYEQLYERFVATSVPQRNQVVKQNHERDWSTCNE